MARSHLEYEKHSLCSQSHRVRSTLNLVLPQNEFMQLLQLTACRTIFYSDLWIRFLDAWAFPVTIHQGRFACLTIKHWGEQWLINELFIVNHGKRLSETSHIVGTHSKKVWSEVPKEHLVDLPPLLQDLSYQNAMRKTTTWSCCEWQQKISLFCCSP